MKTKYHLLYTIMALVVSTINAQNALNFDGFDDVVQTNQSGILGSANRTFEAWIKISPTAHTSNMAIMDYGVNLAGSRNTFLIDGSRSVRFISGGTNSNLPSSTTTLQTGQWTHVAFVLNNGTGYTYVNGVQASTGNLSNVNTPAGNANITIGERVAGGIIPFEGWIDEVRVWNVARTAAEISANMNIELCSFPTSLVAYYQFNQGQALGNNSSLTNVIGALGDTAIAQNFAMTGTISNWDSGAAIGPTPIDTSLSQNGIQLTANDSTADSYQWFDCNNNLNLVGDTSRTFTALSNGIYAVIMTKNGCVDTSSCIPIIGVGLDDYTKMKAFQILQNPTKDNFYLINKKGANIHVYLRNIRGQLIESKQNTSENQLLFNISEYDSGLYLLSIQEEGAMHSFKIIKQ